MIIVFEIYVYNPRYPCLLAGLNALMLCGGQPTSSIYDVYFIFYLCISSNEINDTTCFICNEVVL